MQVEIILDYYVCVRIFCLISVILYSYNLNKSSFIMNGLLLSSCCCLTYVGYASCTVSELHGIFYIWLQCHDHLLEQYCISIPTCHIILYLLKHWHSFKDVPVWTTAIPNSDNLTHNYLRVS